MAEPILFVAESPAGVQCPFKGIKPRIQNDMFDGGPYQREVFLSTITECSRDDSGNPVGITQHPIEVWKGVDIDTPFFKECCHRRLLIPKMMFYFFHSLEGDTFLVNYFTLQLERVVVLKSRLVLHDNTDTVKKGKPYVEELLLNAKVVTWKYKRDSDPLMGDQGTLFNVP